MRRPVKMVFTQECNDRSDASKKEYAIKKLTRTQKFEIIS
jgi:putative endonuclease